MAELVIRGGTMMTGGSLGVLDGDIAIDGNRIVAIGADVGRGDTEIDASGRIVMPGLVQAHTHLCQTLFRGVADDMDVIDWLRERVWPLERAHDAASMRASADLGIAEMMLGGTTTILSMESVHHTEESFAAAEASGVRAFIGKALMDRWEPGTEMVGETTDDAWDETVRLVSRWDGAAGGRLRFALSPRGPRNATPEMWKRCATLAEEADLRLHTHVNENRAQADRLGATPEGRDIVALESWGALSDRLVMAHCVWLSEQERAMLADRGGHVCHCPSANLKLASGIAPIPEYLDMGINVALGSDGAACNNRMDAFTEMRLAALVHKPRCGPKSMPASQVVEMATVGGARALGLADSIGRLEVGMLADVIVVDLSGPHAWPGAGSGPAERIVYASHATDVTDVVVDGRITVRDRQLLTGDLGAIRAAAESARIAVLDRAGLPR
jgi:cytosine/adenosine deaminase-related metal-dependent hydrolase